VGGGVVVDSSSAKDFDISGLWDTMIPDAELLSLLCTILTRLEVGEFTIKVRHPSIIIIHMELFILRVDQPQENIRWYL
jgi:histidyl-tRNA synthetase